MLPHIEPEPVHCFNSTGDASQASNIEIPWVVAMRNEFLNQYFIPNSATIPYYMVRLQINGIYIYICVCVQQLFFINRKTYISNYMWNEQEVDANLGTNQRLKLSQISPAFRCFWKTFTQTRLCLAKESGRNLNIQLRGVGLIDWEHVRSVIL